MDISLWYEITLVCQNQFEVLAKAGYNVDDNYNVTECLKLLLTSCAKNNKLQLPQISIPFYYRISRKEYPKTNEYYFKDMIGFWENCIVYHNTLSILECYITIQCN